MFLKLRKIDLRIMMNYCWQKLRHNTNNNIKSYKKIFSWRLTFEDSWLYVTVNSRCDVFSNCFSGQTSLIFLHIVLNTFWQKIKNGVESAVFKFLAVFREKVAQKRNKNWFRRLVSEIFEKMSTFFLKKSRQK